jgi:hypothetical protein
MGGSRLTQYGIVGVSADGKGRWSCDRCSATGTATTQRKAETDLKRHHQKKHGK